MKTFIMSCIILSLLITACTSVNNNQTKLMKKEIQEEIISSNDNPTNSNDTDNITFDVTHYFDFNKEYKLPLIENNIDKSAYNVPIYYDEKVQFYLDLYGVKLADIFQKWIDRSNKYKDIVVQIFTEEGLPLDLIYLAFVESGFNPVAVSHAGATGMWQFIQSTGQLYGLKNNFWTDDRKDFIKATRAAARHLKDLYNIFGDWYLSLAAYNAGAYKLISAIERYNTKDFRELCKYDFLRDETKDYIPKFIAIEMLYKNALSYGFTNIGIPDLFFETIEFDKPVNLFAIAKLIGTSYENLKELNPQLKRPITPPGEKFVLKIPYGTKEILEDKISQLSYDELILVHIYYPQKNDTIESIARKFGVTTNDITNLNGYYISSIYKNRPLFVPIKNLYKKYNVAKLAQEITYDLPKVYIVKKGETMYGIAKKLGVPLVTLAAYNKKLKPNLIRPGDPVILPVGSTMQNIEIANNYKKEETLKKNIIVKNKHNMLKKKKINTTYYTVKKGDTLWNIAKKFNTSVNKLKNTNRLYSANTLTPGKKLKITD
jgi:membrane-bound lytic murein transglycosylase D